MSYGSAARRFALGMIALAVSFQTLDWALNALRSWRVPKNFAVVQPGVLYRSGQLRPAHFQEIVAAHGIRTVICLNPQDVPDESDRARKLGVAWHSFPMPGSGQGEARQFREVLELIRRPDAQPILVHCAAGAYRTGASCALFRIVEQGWTLEDAVREMKFFGFAGQRDLIDHVTAVLATLPERSERTVLR